MGVIRNKNSVVMLQILENLWYNDCVHRNYMFFPCCFYRETYAIVPQIVLPGLWQSVKERDVNEA